MKELFDVHKDPNHVIVDLSHAKVMDLSAIEALNSLAKKYADNGKHLSLRNPGYHCRLLLESAQGIATINFVE